VNYYNRGYFDSWVQGTLRIIHLFREADLAEPKFEEKNGGVSITLIYKSQTVLSEPLPNNTGKTSEKIINEARSKTKFNGLKGIGSENGGYWQVVGD